jgi:2-amino-4-hydroxy-6-hydroxymethyldihydropteridine diphosphokinase
MSQAQTNLKSNDAHWRRGVYLGLGANMNNPLAQITQALTLLASNTQVHICRRSSIYISAPWGITEQNDFLNTVVEVSTTLDASQLLELCLSIEQRLGRNRQTDRWGPRLIDIDLLLDGDLRINTPSCQIPHPWMHERAFVLVPLCEIDDQAHIPQHGSARFCLNQIPTEQVSSVQKLRLES